jgi:hypothetical protein
VRFPDKAPDHAFEIFSRILARRPTLDDADGAFFVLPGMDLSGPAVADLFDELFRRYDEGRIDIDPSWQARFPDLY